jgi:hypothetical protein
MTLVNPFTERGRITDPTRFAGRWAELSLIFERLEAARPVLIAGPPGIGKSSLLTHVAQSAAVNLEIPELRSFYLDLVGAVSAAEVYQTVVEALRQRGDTSAALEVALMGFDAPVLLCLDNTQAAIAAGWGEGLLEALARMARGGALMLVAAIEGPAPPLSERFAAIRLGALAQAEVRLLIETYLDVAGISFSATELREIAALSAAHPAYLQRAAFHLFESKLDPSIDWRATYLAEARARPIPGAPLPPAVFEGQAQGHVAQSIYGEEQYAGVGNIPQLLPLPEMTPLLPLAIVLLGALLIWLITTSLLPAALVVIIGAVTIGLRSRR